MIIFNNKELDITDKVDAITKKMEDISTSTEEAKKLKTNLTSELGQGVSVSSLFKDYSNKLSTKARGTKGMHSRVTIVFLSITLFNTHHWLNERALQNINI